MNTHARTHTHTHTHTNTHTNTHKTVMSLHKRLQEWFERKFQTMLCKVQTSSRFAHTHYKGIIALVTDLSLLYD